MLSEADLIAKRATLRWLAKPHPEWTRQDLADALSMSRSWVSKWLRRLRQAGCIAQGHRRKPRPLELRKPGEEVQFDLKDGSHVPSDAEGKRQHVVEIANFVAAFTSIWLHREVRGDFDAETLLEAVAQFLGEHGMPQTLTFDNDPRFVGSALGRDFPSALVRFLWCVGVLPNVIPPHRPDLNAYVERFHRSLGQECLQVHRPETLSEVSELTEAYLSHYNSERPSPRALLWQPTAACGLPDLPEAACCSPDGRS
jgi:transposase InsO family protein